MFISGSFTAYQTITPKGKDGSVEVSIKLNGYNQLVLDKNEVKNPVSGNGIVINLNEYLFKSVIAKIKFKFFHFKFQTPLPKVLDEEEEEEEEPVEGENYSTTLIDYVTINLTSMQEIEKQRKQNP